jgi:CheY-like chemotaxis protein
LGLLGLLSAAFGTYYLVDFQMPEMDGLGVVEKLRERKNCPRAILVTSHPNTAIRERAAKLGVPVVGKPFRVFAELSL